MKKIIKFAFVAAIVAVTGYNVYQTQSVMNGMSEFALANVEALASGEGGTSVKICLAIWGECIDGVKAPYGKVGN